MSNTLKLDKERKLELTFWSLWEVQKTFGKEFELDAAFRELQTDEKNYELWMKCLYNLLVHNSPELSYDGMMELIRVHRVKLADIWEAMGAAMGEQRELEKEAAAENERKKKLQKPVSKSPKGK